MSYRVICPDGVVRHDGDFVHRTDAEHFAEWGHICRTAASHRIEDTNDTNDHPQIPPWIVEGLAEHYDVPLVAMHMALTDDSGYMEPSYTARKEYEQAF